jgi:hypothetical protein
MVELLGGMTHAEFNQQLSTTAGEAVRARKAQSEREACATASLACASSFCSKLNRRSSRRRGRRQAKVPQAPQAAPETGQARTQDGW